MVWTGHTPFDIHTMSLTEDGFLLTFTRPVDAKTAEDPGAYSFRHYYYRYSAKYGSPPLGRRFVTVKSVTVSEDRRRVRLTLPDLRQRRLYELRITGLKSAGGDPLRNAVAYYTLNKRLPNRTTK